MRELKLSTILFMVALGSCATGVGLAEAEYNAIGVSLQTFGSGLILYIMFFLP